MAAKSKRRHHLLKKPQKGIANGADPVYTYD
jgi:hypothetical protein